MCVTILPGFKKFTSTLTITGSTTTSTTEYECVVNMPNDKSVTVTSKKATFYRIGTNLALGDARKFPMNL